MMTKDEALKMAVEALKEAQDSINPDIGKRLRQQYWGQYEDTINACKEALEQPAQEPVAYADYERGTCYLIGTPIPKNEIKNPLYTHPYQDGTSPSKWTALTDEEIQYELKQMWDKGLIPSYSIVTFAHAIEQALKEKNND
jgi:hypothetical protein